MIDFNTSQLTWIVIGACSIGGTGYLSMDTNIKDVSTKIAVVHAKSEDSEKRLIELQRQLTRIEDKLDQRK